MKINIIKVLTLAALISSSAMARAEEVVKISASNVVWNTLGKDSGDSMPLGNGDIGLNVWTEQNGDVLLYISKTDAWAEDGNLVKVGRVRISLTPTEFLTGNTFQQKLLLEDGSIELTGAHNSKVRIWVDAYHPAVRVEALFSKPVAMKVTLEPWRREAKEKVSADVILPSKPNEITWCHHNTKSSNPHLDNITFGATISGSGFLSSGEQSLLAKDATTHKFSIYPLTATVHNINEWQENLVAQSVALESLDRSQTWKAHQDWWRKFWDRSWITIQGDADAKRVTEGYNLQRFITACAGRGGYPIKFNGSIFTMDNPAEKRGKDKVSGADIIEPVNADFRAWGGQYWFQNTRPMYWPRLAAGDFDLMLPFFKMYCDKLPESFALVQKYYGHDGAYFAETSPFWAQLPELKPDKPGKYTDRYFTPILELSAMMLDYYDYTGDAAFVSDKLLPIAKAGLTFFSRHFPRDAEGRLLLDKDNSIEMYWDVTNPSPDIAGLRYVIGRLLELPPTLLDVSTRSEWGKLQAILPPIPIGSKDGKPVLLPYAGEQTQPAHNSENPELYAVYPFRIYGLNKPDLEVARNSFDIRLHKRTGCWHQDPVHAAFLGFTDLAKKDVISNLTNKDPRLRFPAFWARGHDYMPDQDNGGNGELALQKMLLQCDGKDILLLPAWPKEWSADFKLLAPLQTTIEGRVEKGKIVLLKVTPEIRRANVKVVGEDGTFVELGK